jgi:zinc protease
VGSGSKFAVALLALGLVGSGCTAARGGRARGPEGAVQLKIALPVEELDLPNGLHVVLHQERSASRALVHLRYHVGSKDDPAGRAGLAHLYEHLMFRGSRNTGTKDYKGWLEDVGGESNAYTTHDNTDYYANVPPSALPRAIWLESDRMAFPIEAVDSEAFRQERDVVKNEWREHYEDVPLGNIDAIARDAIFGQHHPYGVPTIGRGDELDRVTLEEARAFGGLYYRPNNATLVVCGVFDLPATRALVARYFGTIPAGAPQRSLSFAPPAPPQEQKIVVAAAIDGPAVALVWPAPATHGDGFEELHYGFNLFKNWVRRRLVIEMKIANEVDASYDHGHLGGLLTILVRLKPDASTSSALTTLDEYLAKTSRFGRQYSWDDFSDYKTQTLVGEIGSLEGLEGRARRLLHDIELHGAPNSVQKDLQKLQSVDPADVGWSIEHFLIDGPRVTISVRPDASAPRAGKKVAR